MATSTETPRDLTGDQVQHSHNPKASSIVSNSRMLEILDIVCENVAADWKSLAQCFKLNKADMKQIENSQPTNEDRCWQVLCKWRNMTSSSAQPRQLLEALQTLRQGRMVDIISRLAVSSDNIDRILGFHMDREAKVREAMYVVADSVSDQWRQVALRLGLLASEIAQIEGGRADRSREKCMRALHKWRSLVSLQEYKVTTLIGALKSCGLHRAAGDLTALANGKQLYTRRKRKGEVILYIEVAELDMDQPTQHRTAKGSQRPRHVMAHETLKQYVLNRVFIRLMDRLEAQDREGTHPLVSYFYDLNGSFVTEVSRGGRYVVLTSPSKQDQQEIWELVTEGRLCGQLTDWLVTSDLQQELGLTSIRLRCFLYDIDLMTPRTEVSQTPRSDCP